MVGEPKNSVTPVKRLNFFFLEIDRGGGSISVRNQVSQWFYKGESGGNTYEALRMDIDYHVPRPKLVSKRDTES